MLAYESSPRTQDSAASGVEAGHLIDTAEMTSFHIRILAVVAAVMVLEGIDIPCISFVAPAILKEWQLEPAAFGIVFSVGLVGALVGAAVLGPLGDRFGLKPSSEGRRVGKEG